MQGILVLLSFVIWIGIWIVIVKKRGSRGLFASNLIGGLIGFAVATVFLRVVLPEPAPESPVGLESRAAPSTTNSTPSGSAPEPPQLYAQQGHAAPILDEAQQKPGVTGREIDEITLIYIKHKVYANGAVFCENKRIGKRDMIGCRSQGWDGISQVQVWEYADGKFKSINGSASSLAESKFSNESAIQVSPLPLPNDIDVAAVVAAFGKG